MAFSPASDICTLDADVFRIQAPGPPPLGRPEDPDHRRAGGYSEVRRARVAADVNGCTSGELEEPFEARLGGKDTTRTAAILHRIRKPRLFRAGGHHRGEPEFIP